MFGETSGVFSSPGYPLAYKNNLQCDYNLTVPTNDYVVIEFLPPFELEQCKPLTLTTAHPSALWALGFNA